MTSRAAQAPPARHPFLKSRIARRIFWVLLAAALLPTALSAVLVQRAFVAREDAQARHEAKERLKQIGLRLYDRLDAARTTLAVHAAMSDWRQPAPLDRYGRTHLHGLSTMAGDADVPVLSWQAQSAGHGSAPAAVRLAHRDDTGRAWWIADLSPEYLWSDFRSDGAGAGLCVLGPAGEVLWCPGGVPRAEDSIEWRLFLRAGFGAADWRIVGPRLAPRAGEAGATDAVPLARLVGLALAATLLVAALLGLVMVRRTLVPLEHLTTGTRRLAEGQRDARVGLPPGDEFGELAESLNGMAARIERQFQALEVQAHVDRGILDGAPLATTLRQVLARLAELEPAAAVAIVARDVASRQWLLHLPRPDHVPAPLTHAPDASAWGTNTGNGSPEAADSIPEGVATARAVLAHRLSADSPAWQHEVFAAATGRAARPGACLASAPASWRGEPVALLLLCANEARSPGLAVAHELPTLRDRVALALAAAAREHHLVERAVRDSLTGLLNRNGLHDACDRRLAAGRAESRSADGSATAAPFNVLLVDLDGFKEVNDTLGHPVGDAVLRTVAERLHGALPAGATLARAGGDEFVVLHEGTADEAERLGEALCSLAARPIVHREHVVHLGASVGIASVDERRGGPDTAATGPARDGGAAAERDELLRRADVAMYAAKTAGRGCWRRYADTMDAEAIERAWITRELRRALDEGALEVHYQPRVDPRDGHVSSSEALVRWTHAERGAIPPARFVPVAEDNGLIDRLGRFVLDAALAQRRRWRDQGTASGRVAVNVSARQLRDEGFAAGILAALERHGLAPAELELEITESLFAGDVASVQRALQPLRERGVWVALDDFGTGFSSLAALQSLPIDVLKIDRSFVIDLGVRESAHAVARSVIALARALGKRVVAEGVETAEQERHLLALGCDEFQGYLYAPPLAPAPFEARVQAGFAPAHAAHTTALTHATQAIGAAAAVPAELTPA